MLMVALGRQLGLSRDQLKQAGVAGLLHDIGKMARPNEVLNKSDKLTNEEFNIIRQHPRRGWEILKCYQVDETTLEVCLHHHERVEDGVIRKDYRVMHSLCLRP